MDIIDATQSVALAVLVPRIPLLLLLVVGVLRWHVHIAQIFQIWIVLRVVSFLGFSVSPVQLEELGQLCVSLRLSCHLFVALVEDNMLTLLFMDTEHL